MRNLAVVLIAAAMAAALASPAALAIPMRSGKPDSENSFSAYVRDMSSGLRAFAARWQSPSVPATASAPEQGCGACGAGPEFVEALSWSSPDQPSFSSVTLSMDVAPVAVDMPYAGPVVEQPNAVPEPAALALIAAGLVAMRWRKR